MKKSIFTRHCDDRVSVEYDDILSGIRNCRSFFKRGNYVFEIIGNYGKDHQVCLKLSSRGPTLMCSQDEDFADKIRKEFRKMIAEDKKRYR